MTRIYSKLYSYIHRYLLTLTLSGPESGTNTQNLPPIALVRPRVCISCLVCLNGSSDITKPHSGTSIPYF